MRLFIAEKPSLARAIADALPNPRKRDGYIECGNHDVVTWCAGHILELAPPEAYDPAYKTWQLEHLPVVPGTWKLEPTARDLLACIKRLLPAASRVVHAGDPDREGQLLVDEVLEYLGYRGPVDRLLISDLNAPAVRRALNDLRPNAQYRGLHHAALARQRADWLYGINLTRLYTLLGRAGGYDGVLSVGRVQTPLLGLVVARDLEIEGFQPRPYFVLRAELRLGEARFKGTWQPPDDDGAIVDDEGRLTSRDVALEVQARTSGRSATVVKSQRQKRSEGPPLPYSLPDLQVDAGRRLGIAPKQVLEACQSLYETHRLLTYPRSDCSYLPEGQQEQAAAVLSAVVANLPALVQHANAADRSLRSRAWNDAKVTAHHAIIPTTVTKVLLSMTEHERGVYALVARRYVAQFYPPTEVYETDVAVRIGDDLFRVRGKGMITEGWRALIAAPPGSTEPEDSDTDEAGDQELPELREGANIGVAEVVLQDKHTTPPRRFTEAGLVEAMTGIARFVADPKVKQLLRDTDGIGTPATQAQIIETLFARAFLERKGRQVVSTAVGRALVHALPSVATKPDMTALWEAAMRRIADGQLSLDSFLATVLRQIDELVGAGRRVRSLRVPVAASGLRASDSASARFGRPRPNRRSRARNRATGID
jgi:DNA topoisomerase-3